MSADPPPEARRLLTEREALRRAHDWDAADSIRDRLRAQGWEVVDTPAGSRLRPTLPEAPARVDYAQREDLTGLLDQAPSLDLSVQIIAEDHAEDLRRFVGALTAHLPSRSLELVCIANAPSFDAAAIFGEAAIPIAVETLEVSARLGWADARNLGLRRSRGAISVICDTSLEPIGDFLSPLAAAFDAPDVGIVGPWGMRSIDGRRFEDAPAGDVAAVQAYCMAIRREVLREAGLFDPRFRFYRNADLDACFQARDAGWRVIAVEGLPLVRHEPRAYQALPAEERERLSKRNFYRYLKRWGHRTDLFSPGDDG